MSYPFKICDSIHGFIRFDEIIQSVIDSRPFQRLRYINQLGMTYLIYPGAVHTRFEHSLGVMELATRIYDSLIAPHHRVVGLELTNEELLYWRVILRIAALCHDFGHLPFSHTAENALLPKGGHEAMTIQLIGSLRSLWQTIGSHAEEDIVKLAVSEKSELPLTGWEKMLSQIITEDHFGADRIDYLLRDAHYTGVGYGRFDYSQLIDSLRILKEGGKYFLGITESGLQSVEALLMARYMMYARVYQHPKVGIYNCHMNRFMCNYYSNGVSTSTREYLKQTDFKILNELWPAVERGDEDASILLKLKPAYREVSYLEPLSKEKTCILKELFADKIILDKKKKEISKKGFSILMTSGKLISSREASPLLHEMPHGGKERIYADPLYLEKVNSVLLN